MTNYPVALPIDLHSGHSCKTRVHFNETIIKNVQETEI